MTVAAGAPGGPIPRVQFAQARGARIAYQDWGTGPVVVSVPPFAQNIEVAWEWPAIRKMFERFGAFSRTILFDKRGTGASDRSTQIASIDERVEDLRAVMDDAGVDRAFLTGASEGGPMCLLFAATYPDRVDGVALNGSGPYIVPPEARAARRGDTLPDTSMHLIDTWGTPESVMADVFSPSLAKDSGYRTWLERYCRLSANRDGLIDLMTMIVDVDVTDILADVKCPVLVQHRTNDQVISVENGRAVFAGVRHATMIEYEGTDHFAFAGEQSWLDDLEEFVTGTVQDRPRSTGRVSVTIRTLGRFSVEVDGVEVETAEWGSRRARQLCKRLVAARGWPVTREELFDIFWPDETDMGKLGARLSVLLSAVRRVLGGGVIADRQTVALNLAEVTTDLERVLEPADDVALVDAYRGEFLPEDTDEEWTAGVRDEARAMFRSAASRLAADATSAGEPGEAAALARRLIEVDRYDDTAHRLLFNSLRAADDMAGARRAHKRWSSCMGDIDVAVPPLNN